MSIHSVKNTLPTSRVQTAEQIDQQFQQLAKDLEKEFLREMMKSMRQTVSDEGGMMQANSAEKLFSEQLDGEYIDKWGETGGVGLSKTIYDQLIQKYGAQYGLAPREIKGIGPIAIEAQKQKAIKTYQQQEPTQSQSFHPVKIEPNQPSSSPVTSGVQNTESEHTQNQQQSQAQSESGTQFK